MARLKLTRDYFISKDAEKIFDDGDVAVHKHIASGRLIGTCFIGKAIRPSWNCYFRSEADLKAATDKVLAGRKAHVERKEKLKAERKQPIALKAGDVLTSAWGYDQTNREFWEVTKVIGAATVEVRELAQSTTTTGWLVGTAVPTKIYAGDPKRCRVTYGNSVRVHDHAHAFPWNGTPEHWSAYA